tara:strand:- start:982 stop:1209 length:228 start_codon:yes stop_codon:yes gene_type:complete
MLKTTAHICEYENARNASGYSLQNTKKAIEKEQKNKNKPINPKEVFEGSKFKNLKKGNYRSAKPQISKPIKEDMV